MTLVHNSLGAITRITSPAIANGREIAIHVSATSQEFVRHVIVNA